MNTRTRNWLSMGAAPLALSLALLAPARASHAAEVDVVVTHSPVTPASPTVGQTFYTSFSANVTNRPGANNECEIRNKRYHWTISANNGTTTVPLYDNPNGAATFPFPHTVNEVCHYTITASCVVTFDTDAACGGDNQSASPVSDDVGVDIQGAPCNAGETSP